MRILVAGASGFVGARLCRALELDGHEVRAMTRRPEQYTGSGTAVAGEVADEASLRAALEGCAVAYYLVHSLDSADFEQRDAEGARTFSAAAVAAGVGHIVYLGGLGNDDEALSRHLRSRHQVEELLAADGVPVTVLRAGIVVGHGGISWELTRQLVEHLPVMVTPRWVETRTQPIAVDDVVRYLVEVLRVPAARGRTFEVGGPDILQYRSMLQRVAALEGRRLLVLPVPLLSPRLSSLWLALVTDVDLQTGRSLVDSMTNEVVVRDESLRQLLPFTLRSYDEMVLDALAERAAEKRSSRHVLLDRLSTGLVGRGPRHAGVSAEDLGRRRRVVLAGGLVGTALLRRSLTRPPGSAAFYGWTLSVASTWLIGGLTSGPLHLGRLPARNEMLRRPVVAPVATGVAAFGLFYAGALVARRLPVLDEAIASVLRFADAGSTPLVLATTLANGAAEEVFFRGALYAAVGERHQVAVSTAAYTAVTLATRNPALVLAAGVMGSLFSLQRRASGGIQAPLVTHLTWSALMLRHLPQLFRRSGARRN